MSAAYYLAFDLGASSGRALLGTFDGQRLKLEELLRFANGPVSVQGRLYWNVLALFEHIKAGIGLCTQRGLRLDGIGIDTWGVDFGLLGRGGELLEAPRHYRDPRTRGMLEQAFERVPREEIYARTGIQFMALNTVYQLLAVAQAPSRLLDVAERLLFMPDLLAYWLTGEMQSEHTIASTSQLLAAGTHAWDGELMQRLGLPTRIMPPLVAPGTPGRGLLPEVAAEVGQETVTLVRTASHDTAAAVAAVPASGEDWAYVSSGTWSLAGVELVSPCINAETLAAGFTNEVGVQRATRFLKNICGLWLVQECQRVWTGEQQDCSHEALAQAAEGAPPLRSLINPDAAEFAEPGDMPARIRNACRSSGQPVPETQGEVVRCVLESLALRCHQTLRLAERLTGRAIGIVHIVGGGARNALLSQLTADATGKPVVAGPAEATAIGNIMVQALGQGRVGSLTEMRAVVAQSSTTRRYESRDQNTWSEARERFDTLWPTGG